MPSQDQLEIIGASGEIEFYDLNPIQGITNIGRHKDNDIVIDSPGVAPFHVVLDHRQKPFRLIVLNQERGASLSGNHLPPNMYQEIHHRDIIEVDGHTIIVLEADAASPLPKGEGPGERVPYPLPERSASALVSLPAPPAADAPPVVDVDQLRSALTPPPLPAPPALAPAAVLQPRPPDQTDDVIITELPEREWTIEVEQTVTLQLTIVNGGPIVAMFQVAVEGLEQDWVMILPPQVNLNEGGRTTVTVAITPPRQPSSRAGAHQFAIVVTSPNHPGRRSQQGATLTLNPYHEFAVGELAPKQQSVSWFKQFGQVTLPIANTGNSHQLFRLEGTDDERACSFEFQVPGEAASLATQAEMRLSPEEVATIPIHITPRSRRLIGLRKRNYSFTITTTLLGAAQTPRTVLGQLRSAPLIGFWHILLILLLVAAGIMYLFVPGANPRLYSEQGQRVEATDNELLLLYNAARFKRLGPRHILNRVNGAALDITLEHKLTGAPDNTYEVVEAALDGPRGQVPVAPTVDVVYRLTVENWISLFLPRLARTATYDVSVVPILPDIQVVPDQISVEDGQPVTLSWHVQHADRLVLKTQDGLILETFKDPEPTGSYQIAPEGDTVFIFEAHNLYTKDEPETANATVDVFDPPPVIAFFMAQPNAVIEGTPVALSWRVTGADRVSIESDDPIDRPMEVGPEGPPINRQPTRTTLYTLKAIKGEATAVAHQAVGVTPAPTPTGTPSPPEIIFFTAAPDEMVQGVESQVTLKWAIRGTTTNVEISGPSLSNPISNLKSEDAISVTVEDSTLFVLAAFNQDQKDSQNVQVQVTEPTPTPSPPPPTATPIPPPRIFFFKVEPSNSADVDKVKSIGTDRYAVVVGTDIKLTWETSTDAESVTLSPINQAFGPGKNEFEMFKFSLETAPSNQNPKQYTLIAQGAGGAADTSLEIEVLPKSIPQPPSSVGGTVDGDDNVIKWTWSGNEADILGFKVYRSDMPPGDDFIFSQEILDPGTRSWTDVGGGCSKIYQVVTLYEGLDLTPQETVSGGTSWASDPCP